MTAAACPQLDTPIVYHFQHKAARPQLTRCPTTWQALVEALTYEHDERDEKDGPGFILADFSTPYRKAENVVAYTAVCLDLDTHADKSGRPVTPPSPAYAVEQLRGSGLAGIVYTTHNHETTADLNGGKPAGPRYRVVVPLSAPIEAGDLLRVTLGAARLLHLDGPGLDPKSWVVGQFFFMPSCRPGGSRMAAAVDGAALDPETIEEDAAPEPAPAPAHAPVVQRQPAVYAPGTSMFDEARAHARGQWRGILSSLGVAVPDHPRMHAACPGCGGKDRFRFDDKDGDGTFLCSQGGAGTLAGDGFDLVQHARHVDAAEALRLVRQVLGLQQRRPVVRTAAPERQAHASDVDPDTGEILDDVPPPANDNEAEAEEPAAAAPAAWPDPIDPFGVGQPPDLPLDVLPAAFRDYVADQAALLGCDPAVIGLSAVVAAAACIHDDIELQPKRRDPTWTESARLWLAVVGDPSAKKSPAIRKAMRQVYKIDMRMAEDNARAFAEWEQHHAEWKEARKAKNSGDLVQAEPKKPARRRLVVEDTTVEALSEVLRDNPSGVLTYKDELTGWFAGMDAYKGGGKGASMDRAHWLEAYNGGRRIIDRVQRGNIIVPNWSTCIIGGIQPDMMRRVSANMGNDGLLQRFMVLVAKPAKLDEDRDPDMDAMERFRDMFDQLTAIKPGGQRVTLSPEAHLVRERVAARADAMLRAFDHPHIVAWLGKWTGLFARLLLTYHVIECAASGVYPTENPVGADTARQVERLMCDVLLHHAVHFYTEVIDVHDRQENVRQLARLILAKRLERITKRDLTLYWKASRKLEPWEVRNVLEALCTLGWLEADGSSLDVMDGKPRAWAVNPKVHDLFARQAENEASRRQRAAELLRDMRAG